MQKAHTRAYAIFASFLKGEAEHYGSRDAAAMSAIIAGVEAAGTTEAIAEFRAARRDALGEFGKVRVSRMENILKALRDDVIKPAALKNRRTGKPASLQLVYAKLSPKAETKAETKGASPDASEKAETVKMSQARLIELITATCAKSEGFRSKLLKALTEIGLIGEPEAVEAE